MRLAGHFEVVRVLLLLMFFGVGQHRPQFLDEILHVFELAINAGEADIGHFIEVAQVLHQQFAHMTAFNFRLEIGFQLVLDGANDGFDLLVADRALPAGLFQAAFDLGMIERFSRAVLLDDLHRGFDPLIGRVPLLAGNAFATPPDGESILTRSRIKYPIVVDKAVGALHGKTVQC